MLTLKNRTWYSELTTLLSDGKKLRLRGRDGFFLNRFVFSEHEETTLLALFLDIPSVSIICKDNYDASLDKAAISQHLARLIAKSWYDEKEIFEVIDGAMKISISAHKEGYEVSLWSGRFFVPLTFVYSPVVDSVEVNTQEHIKKEVAKILSVLKFYSYQT